MKKIIVFLLIFACLTMAGCNPERNKSYSKEITTRDIKIEKVSNSLYFSFKVRPQVDVNHLMITIAFYDKNEYPVGARTKKLGKVLAGQEYTIEFNENDFTLTEMLAIYKYKFIEADGTLWIEQETHGICFEHNYDDGIVNKKATCGCLGETIYTCKNCNYKKSELIPRTEHNWVNDKYTDSIYICTKCCIRCDWKD